VFALSEVAGTAIAILAFRMVCWPTGPGNLRMAEFLLQSALRRRLRST